MIDDLNTRITRLDRHFRETNESMTERERLFSRVIKLNEEVGELCEAILAENDKNQRKKERFMDVDNELADVLICLLLIARGRNKNIWSEVLIKIKKVEERFNLK